MRTVTIAVSICTACECCLEDAERCFGKFEGVTSFSYDDGLGQVTLNAQGHITDDMILARFRCLAYPEAKIVA